MAFTLRTFAASAALALAALSGAAQAASLVTFGDPWGQKAATIDAAMDAAFGGGTWADIAAPVDTAFLTGDGFVYVEGGDRTTDAMERFLGANAAALLGFLRDGGHIFVNAAPNQGDGLAFGGLTTATGSAAAAAMPSTRRIRSSPGRGRPLPARPSPMVPSAAAAR